MLFNFHETNTRRPLILVIGVRFTKYRKWSHFIEIIESKGEKMRYEANKFYAFQIHYAFSLYGMQISVPNLHIGKSCLLYILY